MKIINYMLPLCIMTGIMAMEQEQPVYRLTKSPHLNFHYISPNVQRIGDQILHNRISHDEGFAQLTNDYDKRALSRYLLINKVNRANQPKNQ